MHRATTGLDLLLLIVDSLIYSSSSLTVYKMHGSWFGKAHHGGWVCYGQPVDVNKREIEPMTSSVFQNEIPFSGHL